MHAAKKYLHWSCSRAHGADAAQTKGLAAEQGARAVLAEALAAKADLKGWQSDQLPVLRRRGADPLAAEAAEPGCKVQKAAEPAPEQTASRQAALLLLVLRAANKPYFWKAQVLVRLRKEKVRSLFLSGQHKDHQYLHHDLE